jgi:hypothetical protein
LALGPYFIIGFAPRGSSALEVRALAGCLFMTIMGAMAWRWGRSSTSPFGSAGLLSLIGVSYVVAANFAASRHFEAGNVEVARWLAAVQVIGIASVATCLLRAVAAQRRLRLGPGDGTPDSSWTWGLLYNNPDDPALFVPKRFGIGFTVNFGHSSAWWILFLAACLIGIRVVTQ